MDHPLRPQLLAIGKLQLKHPIDVLNLDYADLLKRRHQLFLECVAVVDEQFEAHRDSEVRVLDMCSAQCTFSVYSRFGSYRCDAKPSDFKCMPAGICSAQFSMGRPKIENGMPAPLKCAAIDRP